VAHVVEDVLEVDPQADHRGLVTDRGGAGQASPERRFVLHLGPRVVGPIVQVRGRARVRVPLQAVEYPDPMALRDEGVHHVGADEPGPAGDQHVLPHHSTVRQGRRADRASGLG